MCFMYYTDSFMRTDSELSANCGNNAQAIAHFITDRKVAYAQCYRYSQNAHNIHI